MTKSNETSQVEMAGARRRGNLALWISLACGTVSVAILMLVMISVYNADRTYSTGVHTIAGLEAEIKRLNEDRQAAEKAVVEARKASETAISEARAASQTAIADARAASETAIEDARNRNNEARQRAVTAEKEASQLLDQVDNRRAELARISANLQSTKNALADNLTRIQDAEEKQKQLTAGIKSAEETLTGFKVDIAGDTAKIEQLKRELTALESSREELDGLQRQISERRDVLADLAVQESNEKETIARTKATVAGIKTEQTEHLNQLKALQAELSAARREQDAAEAKRSLYVAEVAELTVSRDTLQKQVAELQRRYDGLEAQIAQAREVAEPRAE